MDGEEVENAFRNMPEPEKYRIISSLLVSSDDYFKWRIKNLINGIETSDILTLLPPEVQLHILSFIDGLSLLSACRVSKPWRKLIKSFDSLWREKALHIGVCMEDKPTQCSWVDAFIMSMKQLHYLRSGKAFCEKFMHLQDKNDVVKAIDFRDGYICTVSDKDVINIWELNVNIPLLTFSVCTSVSCATFHPGLTLVCGHFSGILTSWDLRDMNTVCCRSQLGLFFSPKRDLDLSEESLLINKFRMHSGPVFSCDFSEDIELLVSGGADSSIKLWNLRNGEVLRSIVSEGQWVLKVRLLPGINQSNKVIAMRKECVDMLEWPSDSEDLSYDSEDPSEYFQNLNYIEKTKSIPLNEDDNTYTIPGFQISSSSIGLIVQDLEEKYSTLVLSHIDTFHPHSKLCLPFKVRKFLSLGKRFAMFLTAGKALYTSSLVIVDTTTGKIVGTQAIPHSKMTTPDGSQIVVGDTRWLDGLRGWEFNEEEEEKEEEEATVDGDNLPNSHLEECQCLAQDPIQLASNAAKCLKCIEESQASDGGVSDTVFIHKKINTLKSERKFLILAAGLKTENGKFFTLWWRRSIGEKTKTD